MLRGIQVSSGGVVASGCATTTKTRHHRLEETVRRRKIKLSEEQIQALERFDPEYRERHIEVGAKGERLAVDTFFAGTLKGVGKVYIQTVLDCFSRFVWARLYTSKMPVTARSDPEQPRAAVLREASGESPDNPERQRPRVLRPARQALVRTLPAARGDRAPDHEGRQAPVERLHRSSGCPLPTASRCAKMVLKR